MGHASPSALPLLQYLKAIAGALAAVGPNALFYLAAAVSDFYLPWQEMVRGCSGARACT